MAHVTGFPDRRSRPFRINVVITPAVPKRTHATLLPSVAASYVVANRAARQVLPLIISAQATRAILLASATATTLNGRRARSRVIQGNFSGLFLARRRTETAPTTRSLRR